MTNPNFIGELVNKMVAVRTVAAQLDAWLRRHPVTDIKQIGQQLNQLRAYSERFRTFWNQLRNDPPNAVQHQRLVAEANMLIEALNALKAHHTELATAIDALVPVVKEIETVPATGTAVASTELASAQELKAFDRHLAALVKRIKAEGQRLDQQLKAELEAETRAMIEERNLLARATTLHQQLKAANAELQRVNKQINDFEQRVIKLLQEWKRGYKDIPLKNSLSNEGKQIEGQVLQLEGTLKSIEANIATLSNEIKTLEVGQQRREKLERLMLSELKGIFTDVQDTVVTTTNVLKEINDELGKLT
jgi:DNA repair exonuclease SbcCD ATPase subunit